MTSLWKSAWKSREKSQGLTLVESYGITMVPGSKLTVCELENHHLSLGEIKINQGTEWAIFKFANCEKLPEGKTVERGTPPKKRHFDRWSKTIPKSLVYDCFAPMNT